MVVDANGNILKDANTGNSLEGNLSGAVSFTLPRINTVYKTDYYVNVFVKPYDNYLLTRLDAEPLVFLFTCFQELTMELRETRLVRATSCE